MTMKVLIIIDCYRNFDYAKSNFDFNFTITGFTPLHVACANGNLAVIELMLNRNADASSEDADGENAMQILEKWMIGQNLNSQEQCLYDTISARMMNATLNTPPFDDGAAMEFDDLPNITSSTEQRVSDHKVDAVASTSLADIRKEYNAQVHGSNEQHDDLRQSCSKNKVVVQGMYSYYITIISNIFFF